MPKSRSKSRTSVKYSENKSISREITVSKVGNEI